MKKKGVILLITLFFIISISILILKNLSDTNSYLTEQNSKFAKVQMLYYINNIKNEFLRLLKDTNKEGLVKYFNINFPVQMEDIKIKIRLEEYNKYNINLLKAKDKKDYYYFSEFLKSYDIYDIYILQSILSELNTIRTNKQLDEVFKRFDKESYNNNLFKVKNYIGFVEYDKRDFSSQASNENLLVELFIEIKYLKYEMKAYYILKKETQGVEYFEYSFK
ncbi:hypothetical protein PJV93_11395 [Aliarcobacter butzleri]|uniref:Uncharacterized protein n=1 Tax=Aliarcobacter butzleri TaxID=28197 RepID=A0AAW7QF75_9BACT|nr:hypothetical protein [Aliarcobacter butzleri]MDN5108103.1 hypothetical protein [Aliarcobacter butzleri]MDN5124512.1 hypothetical protein [Aliarcobacter butzleri]